jgi:hypothetical protein
VDEQEVERVARLIHNTYRAFYLMRKPEKPPLCPFEELSEYQQASMLAVARAIVADRLGTPTTPVDEYAPTAVVKAGQ